MINNKTRIGAVVIGRNEGQRLVTCLKSLKNNLDHIVYVDSGSSDGSMQEAAALGVATISLDMSTPFTAARARNEGANYLLAKHIELSYLQFIDGDCEMQPKWIDTAAQFLDEHGDYAVACGRRRERFPERTIYNQLCDIEWNTPVGDASACGGDALIRAKAFKLVSGYRDDLIAGEEPEMCFRLRKQGLKIRRLDAEMTMHDAAMTKVSQWWKRCMRGGYAFILGVSIHRKYWIKEVVSAWFWAGMLPMVIVILTSLINVDFIFLFSIYLIQILKMTVKNRNLKYSIFIVLAKFPEIIGQCKFLLDKLFSVSATIIEYK